MEMDDLYRSLLFHLGRIDFNMETGHLKNREEIFLWRSLSLPGQDRLQHVDRPPLLSYTIFSWPGQDRLQHGDRPPFHSYTIFRQPRQVRLHHGDIKPLQNFTIFTWIGQNPACKWIDSSMETGHLRHREEHYLQSLIIFTLEGQTPAWRQATSPELHYLYLGRIDSNMETSHISRATLSLPGEDKLKIYNLYRVSISLPGQDRLQHGDRPPLQGFRQDGMVGVGTALHCHIPSLHKFKHNILIKYL